MLTLKSARLGAYLILASCALLAAPASSMGVTGPATLTFVEPEKGATFAFVDNAPKTKLVHGEPRSISPGDQVVFSGPVEEAGKKVGRTQVSCVATKGAKRFAQAGLNCSGIYVLTGGILTSSTVVTGPGALGAITGGTGAYANAHGTLVGKSGEGSSTTTVTLEG